jgi:1,4-dihydroxy-2-naphthoate octaprenyltransferase
MKLKTVTQSMRVPFLLLTFACVFLGASIVVANQVPINFPFLGLALMGALLAHISVNTLNEYFDFKSGLDLVTDKTPFSGGSGALPQNPQMLGAVFKVGVASLAATLLIGSFFIWKHGIAIMPIGIAGLVLIWTYTGWVNKHPFICLVAPGFGFGFLMVVGTSFVLAGNFLPQSWLLVAAVPFFLVNNLLLLNQYPDIKADASVGRNHFPIAYGVERSSMVYGLFTIATFSIIIACIMTGLLPMLSLIALLPMPLALFSTYGAIKYGAMIGKHPQYLGANVAATLLTIFLLGLSIILG